MQCSCARCFSAISSFQQFFLKMKDSKWTEFWGISLRNIYGVFSLMEGLGRKYEKRRHGLSARFSFLVLMLFAEKEKVS